MSPLLISIFVFLASIAAAMLGFRCQRPLRLDQQNEGIRASGRVAVGQVTMLTFIVLGMVTAAARETYNSGNTVVASMAVEALELDRLLDAYGPDAAEARTQLKAALRSRIEAMGSDIRYGEADLLALTNGSLTDGVYGTVQSLQPASDLQRSLQQQAITKLNELTRARWYFSVRPAATPGVLLYVVALWIGLQAFCLGLFGERNRAVYLSIGVLAVVFASAAFLLLELEGPFSGYLRVSVAPLQEAEQLLGR